VRGRPWLATWTKLELTAQDFIRTGTAALKTKRYAEAQEWYGWAAITKPRQASRFQDLACGLMYVDQGAWAEALPLLERVAETRGRFDELPLGTLYYQIGKIQKEQLGQWSIAQKSFEQALRTEAFLSNLERADAHYHRGVILWYAGQQRAAVDEFGVAISIIPYHYGALVELGKAYWTLDGDLSLAETTLYKAIDVSAGGKWAYKALGDLYYQAGRASDALAQYEEVLRIDPADQDAQTRVKELESP
jgi:tetratricopeptide (TPR) repeat protein